MNRSPYRNIGLPMLMDRLMMQGLEWLGLYYGSYRAIVVDRQPNDDTGNPNIQGKIEVRVPAIDGRTQDVTRIAYPITPIAVGAFGIKSLPPDNSFVWVEFENGKPDIPLWKGGWWRMDEMPEDLQDADAHGWFTPGGHQLLFLDTDGSTELRLRHSSGAELIIDNDGNVNLSNVSGKIATVGKSTLGDEKSANGETLVDLFGQTLDAIVSLTVTTGTGPSSVPTNLAQFIAIKAQLQTAISNTVKIAK